jgi:hypothetical protein
MIYTTASDTYAVTTLTSFARTLLDDGNQSSARTTLGLTPGTDVQAYDATLTALAAYNTNGILTQTAADTFVGRTITGTANEITATNGDGVSGNPTLSLPSALTFTGKTVTGGTFAGVTINASSAIASSTVDSSVIGGSTPAAGTFTTLTTTGAFTSLGIDDNATGERLQLADALLSIGATTSASSYTLDRPLNDGSLIIQGGTANTGGTLQIWGSTHATRASDYEFRANNAGVYDYDYSATLHTFSGNAQVSGTIKASTWNADSSYTLQVAGVNEFFLSATAIYPASDNANSCGQNGNRWTAVWAANATIQTSDAREKTPFRDMLPAEIDAAKEIAKSIGFYHWLVNDNGEHCGVTVQKVIEIMDKYGLDPLHYAFLIYEEDRYSLMATELLMFIARGQEERLSRLEK